MDLVGFSINEIMYETKPNEFFWIVQELEAALEHASNVAFEYQKNANKYQEAIRQSSMHLDEEQKTKAIARETLANAGKALYLGFRSILIRSGLVRYGTTGHPNINK